MLSSNENDHCRQSIAYSYFLQGVPWPYGHKCSCIAHNFFLTLQEVIAQGDTIRTIVKFLSNELSQEREEAVSLLFELSKSEFLCEKIGGINGAILILMGMTSSKSEDVMTIEKADKTLENLEKCEKNVRQMAENGRLQPLLALLLEGASSFYSFYSLKFCSKYFSCSVIVWIVMLLRVSFLKFIILL